MNILKRLSQHMERQQIENHIHYLEQVVKHGTPERREQAKKQLAQYETSEMLLKRGFSVFSSEYRQAIVREAVEAGASEHFLHGMGIGFAEIDRIRKETGYSND